MTLQKSNMPLSIGIGLETLPQIDSWDLLRLLLTYSTPVIGLLFCARRDKKFDVT